MKLINTFTLEIKKSKFIGYYYEINDIKDITLILDNLKKEHKKAKHIPYAYKFQNTAKKYDDKEPTGTAGIQIYNILEREHLDNKMIAIVRYFGGTKLGAGLLARTYAKCANEAIKND